MKSNAKEKIFTKKSVLEAWIRLALLYQCAILERSIWLTVHLRGKNSTLASPYGILPGADEIGEKQEHRYDFDAIKTYGRQINSHRAAFRSLAASKGMDPDLMTHVLPGGAGARYAESFSNNRTVETMLEIVDVFCGGEVDSALTTYLHNWYEENLTAFLANDEN